VVDSRGEGDTIEYKVRWRYFPASFDTWEPSDNLKNSREAVVEYLQRRTAKLTRAASANRKKKPAKAPKQGSPATSQKSLPKGWRKYGVTNMRKLARSLGINTTFNKSYKTPEALRDDIEKSCDPKHP
jgi:Chromo (CHRromatin Organisation MOdifier) domain